MAPAVPTPAQLIRLAELEGWPDPVIRCLIEFLNTAELAQIARASPFHAHVYKNEDLARLVASFDQFESSVQQHLDAEVNHAGTDAIFATREGVSRWNTLITRTMDFISGTGGCVMLGGLAYGAVAYYGWGTDSRKA